MEIITINNIPEVNYYEDGFIVDVIVNSEGVKNPPAIFKALVDSGAKSVCISQRVLEEVLEATKTVQGVKLKPYGQTKVRGFNGEWVSADIYCIPIFSFDVIVLRDLLVVVPPEFHYDCIIGRSVLHQCVHTIDPEANTMIFEFKDSLKPNIKKRGNKKLFSSVSINNQEDVSGSYMFNKP